MITINRYGMLVIDLTASIIQHTSIYLHLMSDLTQLDPTGSSVLPHLPQGEQHEGRVRMSGRAFGGLRVGCGTSHGIPVRKDMFG